MENLEHWSARMPRSAVLAKWRSLGLCTRCGQSPQSDGRATCKDCREAVKERQSQRRIAAESQGLCMRCCNRPRVDGGRDCRDCSTEGRGRGYRQHAGPCVLCGFEFSDIHHIDEDHSNNAQSNLVSLCPNHHRLVHRGLIDSDELRKRSVAVLSASLTN